MKTIGELITQQSASSAAARTASQREVRTYRVRRVICTFSDVDVAAASREEAVARAEQGPHSAPVFAFSTAPSVARVEVFQPWNNEWAEVRRE